jgi:hypothetical protein
VGGACSANGGGGPRGKPKGKRPLVRPRHRRVYNITMDLLEMGLGELDWTVRFQVFTAVTTKNAVFWDIKTQFLPHRKHYFTTTEPSQLMLCKI